MVRGVDLLCAYTLQLEKFGGRKSVTNFSADSIIVGVKGKGNDEMLNALTDPPPKQVWEMISFHANTEPLTLPPISLCYSYI